MRAAGVIALCAVLAAAVLATPHPHAHGHHTHSHYFVSEGADLVELFRAFVPAALWDEANSAGAFAGQRAFPKLWLRKFGAALLDAIPQRYHTLAAQRRAERALQGSSPIPRPTGQAGESTPSEPLPGPYWGFLPWYTASAIPASDAASWSAPCVAHNTLTAQQTGTGSDGSATYTLQFDATGAVANSTCSDHYLIGTIERVVFHHVDHTSVGVNTTLQWTLPAGTSANTKLDVDRNGFRVFRFAGSLVSVLLDALDTLYLFACPQNGGYDPPACEQANADFLQSYSHLSMAKRANASYIALDKARVQSGDMFGVMRLDGLDPAISWVFGGSGTGHMTVAMWLDGALHVCESTVVDSYWPTEGLQCHEWDTWMALAQKAMHNAVFLPLSPQMRARFNETAAQLFVKSSLGLDYGYRNMLWGWVDSVGDDNYPSPWLSQQLHQLLPTVVARLAPAFAAQLWTDAFNMRLGLPYGTALADTYAAAYAQGLSFGALTAVPEQDDWQYVQVDPLTNATVVGPQMVCNVFVCAVWKAAGLFADIDSDIQCTESTDWDIYTSQMFDSEWPRPQACVDADPDQPFCQVLGNYRMVLNGYNSRPVVRDGWTSCPRGSPPDFAKPIGC